jgi:hypothetical protein
MPKKKKKKKIFSGRTGTKKRVDENEAGLRFVTRCRNTRYTVQRVSQLKAS